MYHFTNCVISHWDRQCLCICHTLWDPLFSYDSTLKSILWYWFRLLVRRLELSFHSQHYKPPKERIRDNIVPTAQIHFDYLVNELHLSSSQVLFVMSCHGVEPEFTHSIWIGLYSSLFDIKCEISCVHSWSSTSITKRYSARVII